jgi:hypothetical protein
VDVALDWDTSLRSAMGSQIQTNYGIPAEQGGANVSGYDSQPWLAHLPGVGRSPSQGSCAGRC